MRTRLQSCLTIFVKMDSVFATDLMENCKKVGKSCTLRAVINFLSTLLRHDHTKLGPPSSENKQIWKDLW